MTYTIKTVGDIGEIGAEAWDACANPEGCAFDPFLSFAFLNALEESESAAPSTGWAPYPLSLQKEDEADDGDGANIDWMNDNWCLIHPDDEICQDQNEDDEVEGC